MTKTKTGTAREAAMVSRIRRGGRMFSREHLLREADGILARLDRCAVEVLLDVGRWMVHWKEACGYKTIAAAGQDAARYLYRRRQNENYFYLAHRAATELSAEDQATIVEYALAISDVRGLMKLPESGRKLWLADIRAHRVIPPYGIGKPRTSKSGGGTAAAHINPEDHHAIVSIQLYGGEPEEVIQSAIESLLSYALKRRHLPVKIMCDEALRHISK